MNKTKLLTAVCCTAMLFAACEKSEPTNNSSEDQTIFTGTENGYEWVDLGLSVKWATCNLGATKPEEYGNYYAWGEIATKDSYTWSNYKYANGSYDALTKYCDNSKYGQDGFTDELTTLTAADDAATQICGGNWRMPTIDEWKELFEKCTWTWITKNSINGYEVKAANGSSIFLPAAGERDGTKLSLVGTYGNYWSSSLEANKLGAAWYVYFSSDHHSTGDSDRHWGHSIRPVMK
jgi:uncharacterized protein (TIGR02145 family)